MTERENIADEQKGTENRALGDPLSDRRECGLMTRERDELFGREDGRERASSISRSTG